MRSNGTTFTKRQRERAKREKKQEKAVKRVERKAEREPRAKGEGDIDPDIADIVPGPQPIPDEMAVE